MPGYPALSMAVRKIAEGLQEAGFSDQVHIVLPPEDGRRIEQAYRVRHETIITSGGSRWKACTLHGVHFRWPAR